MHKPSPIISYIQSKKGCVYNEITVIIEPHERLAVKRIVHEAGRQQYEEFKRVCCSKFGSVNHNLFYLMINTMADAGEERRKRQRDTPIDMAELMQQARIIWRRKNPFEAQAASTEDRKFREHFGCCAEVAMIAWDFLAAYDFLPPDGTIEQFLWSLMFLKVYAKAGPMSTLCGGADYETIMKYVWLFVYALAHLEQYVVSGSPLLLYCCFYH